MLVTSRHTRPENSREFRGLVTRRARRLARAAMLYYFFRASSLMSNRLASETSPYLRQHADNPVDWFPWGDEAWAEARRRDVPVLVSIGYSSCHWCHVMAHESFEDDEVGALVNTLFVSIKVDREERPDVDSVYMDAVQAMTGSGGWPMTVFCLPDGRPFFAGTYFPKLTRGNHLGFAELCRRIDELW